MLEISGATKDGQFVVRNIFKIHKTYGIPLDVIFENLRAHNLIPDWQMIVVEAVDAGMSVKRAIAKIDPAITDIYGSEFRDVIIARLSVAIEKDEAWRYSRQNEKST